MGVKVTVRVQNEAGATLVPQSSVSAKSPVTVLVLMDSGAVPMLRSTVELGAPVVPTVSMGNCRAYDSTATAEPLVGPIFATKVSSPPDQEVRKAVCVTGKSVEEVMPVK